MGSAPRPTLSPRDGEQGGAPGTGRESGTPGRVAGGPAYRLRVRVPYPSFFCVGGDFAVREIDARHGDHRATKNIRGSGLGDGSVWVRTLSSPGDSIFLPTCTQHSACRPESRNRGATRGPRQASCWAVMTRACGASPGRELSPPALAKIRSRADTEAAPGPWNQFRVSRLPGLEKRETRGTGHPADTVFVARLRKAGPSTSLGMTNPKASLRSGCTSVERVSSFKFLVSSFEFQVSSFELQNQVSSFEPDG